MNTRQFIKYAEENGYDSVMFTVQNGNGKHVCAGQCLDIYYEFVTIPVLGDGFIRVSDLEETIGNDIQFEVISKKNIYTMSYLILLSVGKTSRKKFRNR